MKIVLLIVAVVFAVLLYRVLRSSSDAKDKTGNGTKRAGVARVSGGRKEAKADFRAVSINCGSNACHAAQALGEKRFLLGEIAQLPLNDCDVPECKCKFVHHEDRRDVLQGDKRAPSALRSQLYDTSGKVERRSRSRGRRKGDYE